MVAIGSPRGGDIGEPLKHIVRRTKMKSLFSHDDVIAVTVSSDRYLSLTTITQVAVESPTSFSRKTFGIHFLNQLFEGNPLRG